MYLGFKFQLKAKKLLLISFDLSNKCILGVLNSNFKEIFFFFSQNHFLKLTT